MGGLRSDCAKKIARGDMAGGGPGGWHGRPPGPPPGRNLGLSAAPIPKSRPACLENPFRRRNKSLMNQCIKNIPASRNTGTGVA
ncbi:hypothetical protein OH687_18635 [Burkholderia anthina]|nr:hypothetical protein OH687_18635 [Burkholderia anthina]